MLNTLGHFGFCCKPGWCWSDLGTLCVFLAEIYIAALFRLQIKIWFFQTIIPIQLVSWELNCALFASSDISIDINGNKINGKFSSAEVIWCLRTIGYVCFCSAGATGPVLEPAMACWCSCSFSTFSQGAEQCPLFCRAKPGHACCVSP